MRSYLTAAGLVSLAIALLHLVIVFVGAPGYRYFGAGEEMASMDEAGSLFPAIITLGITGVFGVFGLYAFAGAGRIALLPGTKIVLFVITTIYLLRGLGFFTEALGLTLGYDVPVRYALFSLVSLVTGILHLGGIWQAGYFRKAGS